MREEGENVVVMDIDNTYNPFDSGKRLLERAGVLEEDFGSFVERYHEEGQEGNQLVTALRDENWDRDRLRDVARELSPKPREGFKELLSSRVERELPNYASSAGWRPAIEAVTNGNFDTIVAGLVDPFRPNGRYQKPENLRLILNEDVGEVYAIGDSMGDQELIRFAADRGGCGVAYGPDLGKAQSFVEEASVYAGDAATAAAYMAARDPGMDYSRFVSEYGLDVDPIQVRPGELANQKDEDAIKQLEEACENDLLRG